MKFFIQLAPLFLQGKVATPKFKDEPANNWHSWVWVLIGLGIFFRLFHFLDNRSLWLDEIYLSSSLIKMNFKELTAPMLEYEQKAPVTFLWLARLCVLAFGKNEMALRLIPLLSGIASLLIFLPVARFFLKPAGVVIALSILALAPPLVYHAVEIKQYSTELLATIVILYLYTRYHNSVEIKSLLLWGIFGALVIWFSFSSIFILAGVAIGSTLYYLFNKNWPYFFRSIIPFAMWLVSFAMHFFMFSYKHIGSEWLVDWFQHHEAYMPVPPKSLADLKWYLEMPYKFMDYPMGLLWFSPVIHTNLVIRILIRMTPLFLLVLGIGIFMFYKQDKKTFWILILPLLLTLLASGLKVYPFYERLLVFLAPLVILCIARGAELLTNLSRTQRRWQYLVPLVLLSGPLVKSLAQVKDPDLFGGLENQYQRQAFLYINNHYQPGDVVYVYWNDLPPYRFYKNIYNLKYNALEGSDVRFISKDINQYFKNLSSDFKPLHGKSRVWLVYDRTLFLNIGDFVGRPAWYYKANLKQPGKMQIHNQFAALGKEIDTYQTTYINVSLFDLSGKSTLNQLPNN